MASLSSLLSGSGGGLRLDIRMPRGGIRLDTRRLERKYKAGRDKALDRAGSIVRNSAKKQLANRRLASKPIWRRVGEHEGLPLVSMSFQKTTTGKVTSWQPKRFLNSKIRYARDDKRGSVVIGPDERLPDINVMHEKGGSKEVKLVLIRPVPVDRLFQYRVPAVMMGAKRRRKGLAAYVGMWHSTGKRVKGKVVKRDPGKAPAGRYMEKGLAARRAAIAPQFKDQIQGP